MIDAEAPTGLPASLAIQISFLLCFTNVKINVRSKQNNNNKNSAVCHSVRCSILCASRLLLPLVKGENRIIIFCTVRLALFRKCKLSQLPTFRAYFKGMICELDTSRALSKRNQKTYMHVCVCVCVCCLLYTSPSPRDLG